MPPVTPRGVLHELSKQPSVGLRIARTWMIIGSLLPLLAIAMAVAHFGYEVPIQNNNAGRPATSAEVIGITSLFAGGGLFFVIMGFTLRRWLLSRSNSS